jgi:hypothetical protein
MNCISLEDICEVNLLSPTSLKDETGICEKGSTLNHLGNHYPSFMTFGR